MQFVLVCYTHSHTHSHTPTHTHTTKLCCLPQYAKKKEIKTERKLLKRKAKEKQQQLHFLCPCNLCNKLCQKLPRLLLLLLLLLMWQHVAAVANAIAIAFSSLQHGVFVSYGAGSGRVAKVPAVMRHVLGLYPAPSRLLATV